MSDTYYRFIPEKAEFETLQKEEASLSTYDDFEGLDELSMLIVTRYLIDGSYTSVRYFKTKERALFAAQNEIKAHIKQLESFLLPEKKTHQATDKHKVINDNSCNDNSCFVTFPANTPEETIKQFDERLDNVIVCTDVEYVNNGKNIIEVDRKTVSFPYVVINCSFCFNYYGVVNVVEEFGYKPYLKIYD